MKYGRSRIFVYLWPYFRRGWGTRYNPLDGFSFR